MKVSKQTDFLLYTSLDIWNIPGRILDIRSKSIFFFESQFKYLQQRFWHRITDELQRISWKQKDKIQVSIARPRTFWAGYRIFCHRKVLKYPAPQTLDIRLAGNPAKSNIRQWISCPTLRHAYIGTGISKKTFYFEEILLQMINFSFSGFQWASCLQISQWRVFASTSHAFHNDSQVFIIEKH